MIHHHRGKSCHVLTGTILIVTMWIVLVLAGLVLVFTHTVKVEATAAANYQGARQAAAVARGVMDLARAIIAEDAEVLPEDFEAVQIGNAWMWMLSPTFDSDTEQSFGLIDLAAKININSSTEQMLLKLPDMTSELAAAIIDWRDANNQITAGGAESEYYLLQPEPYQCKNAAFESVEELLLVKGASPEILYGEDTNRNGILDPNENDGDLSDPPDDANGRLDRGLLPYITVHSMQLDNRQGGGTANNNPLSASNPGQGVGLINVNTAPRQILACLPGLDESDADILISHRENPSANLESFAWVSDVLPPEKSLAIINFITTESYQYAADIVTIASNGRGFARRYVIIDASQQPPRIVLHQDLTGLGWPLDRSIIDELRNAREMQEILRKVDR